MGKISRSNRHKKRTVGSFLACIGCLMIMSVVLFSGCGKHTEEKEKDSSAKGRYMEKEVELPVQEGESVLNLTKSTEGNIVLFSRQDNTQIFRYEYKEKQWEQTSLEWVDNLLGERNSEVLSVLETNDKTQIIRAVNEEGAVLIARGSDMQSGEFLEIPYLTQQTEFGYQFITDMAVDGIGQIWMYEMYNGKVAIINPDSLEVIQELNAVPAFSENQKVLFSTEDGRVAVNTEEGLFTIYNHDLEETGTLKGEWKEGFQACNSGKEYYFVSGEGIARYVEGNEKGEILLEGSMGAMGSFINTARDIVQGEENTFYVLYSQDKEMTYRLMCYEYDAEAPAVPEHTLQVFGLTENTTVQEAAIEFQKLHPDVKIELRTPSGGGMAVDDIRTLNTELLSGKGADVLLLDGLPLDAYIEKGILKDLTGMTEELLKEDTYMDSLLQNTAQADEKIYGLPIKFSVPVLYGNEEVKRALNSLGDLNAYLENYPEANIFGIANKAYIRDFLFQMYQDEILEKDGVNQKKLTLLLEIEQKLAVNARSEIFDDVGIVEMGASSGNLVNQGMFDNIGSPVIRNHPESVSTNKISSVRSMMIPYTIMRESNLQPETVKDFYLPSGVVGINQNTKQMDIAEEFVKYLFSKEIQDVKLDDGFPVLKSALKARKDEANSAYAANYFVSSSWSFEIEGEDVDTIDAVYPTADEVEHLFELCDSLKIPVKQDCMIWNIYQTEADPCLKGETDAETAAAAIVQKMDTYLAE